MFKSLGLLKESKCPEEPCLRPYCFFAHSQATPTAGPSRPPAASGKTAGVKRDTTGAKKRIGDGDIDVSRSDGQTSGKRLKEDLSGKGGTAASAPMTNGSSSSAARTKSVAASPRTALPTKATSRPIFTTPATSRPTTTTTGQVSASARSVPGAVLTQPSGAPNVSREVKHLRTSKQPYADRQKALQTLFTQYTKLYAPVSALDPDLASRCTTAEELDISATSTDLTSYKRTVHHAAVSISRRIPPDTLDHPSIGTTRVSREATIKADKVAAGRLTRDRCERYILPVAAYTTWRYPDPNDPALTDGDADPDGMGSTQKCDRCEAQFVVSIADLEDRKGECVFHHGRLLPERIDAKRMWVYSCCKRERGTVGCQKGVHVFNEREDDVKLASRIGFKTVADQVAENRRSGAVEAFAEVVGMDCEMIYTTAGYSLARVTILDEKGEVVLDELVRQTASVLDLNTRFSGITKPDLDRAILDIRAVRAAACMFIGPDTIIVGHGLENDLRALRLLHDRVIDTAVLFPHDKGPPYRRALRDLVKEKLGYFIQLQTTNTGHSSAEDAKATLETLQWKVREDGKGQSP